MANNIILPKGFKINDYTISKKLSVGGFSIVYLAYHKKGYPVAIKEFFPNHLHLRNNGQKVDFINMREKHRFQEGLKAFKDETEIIMKLKHKNIIEIINCFDTNGTSYIVMPYEYGMTLSKYISINDNLNETEIILLIEGIFSAVQLLHENNIVHLDLKPNNIWIRPNKETLLLDFGTARIINDPIKSKQPPMHTPGYAAPEQHKDFFQPHRIGPWTDYYGLGATLYALIEKNSPEVSTELFLNNKSTDLLATRQGQYNTILLNIVNTLMALDWEKRQRIVLREIIEQLHRIKPIKQISLAIESLNELMHDANNHFHKELKSEN